jgi:acyl carrier protein
MVITNDSTREGIKERVSNIVASLVRVSVSDIHSTVSFQEIGMDSLDRIELIMLIEDEFGIDMDINDADELDTLTEWVNYLDKNILIK